MSRSTPPRAAGTYVGGTTIGGLLGRLVGGPIAEILDWRAGVFTVAVLCGIAAVGFVAMYNFVGFRLTAAPFHLPQSAESSSN